MAGLAGRITSSLHESNFGCYNCINGITSTADEYNFTSYNCISNITICGRTVEEDDPTIVRTKWAASYVGRSVLSYQCELYQLHSVTGPRTLTHCRE